MPNIDPVIGEKLIRVFIRDNSSSDELEMSLITRTPVTEAQAWDLAERVLASDLVTGNPNLDNAFIQEVALTQAESVTAPS